MDLSNPLRVITPTLDAAVLRALAGTNVPVSGAQVQRIAGTGSADGVRRVLARLVSQGIVRAFEHPAATLYNLNRDHVAAPLIVEFTLLRQRVFDLIAEAVAAWNPQPLHASLFGSFARGEANDASDIDILVVAEDIRTSDQWSDQINDLSRKVLTATGNHAHVVDLTPDTLTKMLLMEDPFDLQRTKDPLLAAWRVDAIHLVGERLMDLMRRLRIEAGQPLKGLG